MFGETLARLAKTDPLDATVLMRFAERADVRLTQKRSANQAELDALITCRRQLCAARTAQSNARLTTDSKAARLSIDAVLKTLDKQIALLDQQIRKRIDADDDFRHLDRQIRSVPGAGPRRVHVVALPERRRRQHDGHHRLTRGGGSGKSIDARP